MPKERNQKAAIESFFRDKPGWKIKKLPAMSGESDYFATYQGVLIFFEEKQPGEKRDPEGLQVAIAEEWEKAGALVFETHGIKEIRPIVEAIENYFSFIELLPLELEAFRETMRRVYKK
jgi:hypothetical protein